MTVHSIASTIRTGDAYAWTGHFNQNVTGTANGLNQLTSVGPNRITVTNYGDSALIAVATGPA